MLPERQYIDEAGLYPEEQPKVHLEVYTNNKKKTKHRHLRKLSPKQKSVVCLLVIFSMCLFYVALEARITQVGYSVNQLQADIADAQEANDRLMVEVEQLASPERIAQYAGSKDGMVAVDESNILYADIDIADDTKAAYEAGQAVSGTATAMNDASSGNADTKSENKASSDNEMIGMFSSLIGKLADARSEAAVPAK
ncbi:MAG: septum formation initiator family protein [Bacillota bacterium]|jgi:cell division protein FtsL